MPKINIADAAVRRGSTYPAPYHQRSAMRVRQALGDAGGLSDFGVNLLQLPPNTWSSQRHRHTAEDEFIYVVCGEVVLVTNAGEEILHAGDCAAFPKHDADGHHLINRSSETAVCLEVGTRSPHDLTTYPDIDLLFDDQVGWYMHKDGTPYPKPNSVK